MTRRLLILLLATNLIGCEKPADNTWQGYIEGEYVLIASPYAGQLQKLYVRRGDKVEAGKPVFALEQESERAARTEAEQRLNAAAARLENLQAARRPAEIDALRAEVTQAKAALALSSSQLAQQQKLFKEGFISQARLDEAQARARARRRARRGGRGAAAAARCSRSGRDAERKAAEGDVAAAQAALAQAAWRLEQKSVAAPVSGTGAGHLLRRRRMGAGGTPGGLAAAAGQREGAVLRARDRPRRRCSPARRSRSAATAARRRSPPR